MLTEAQQHRLAAALTAAVGEGKSLTGAQAERIARRTRAALRKVEWFALGAGVVPQRYARNVGSLGLDGQRRCLAACAAVVGLGGLGGHVVESLARLGVGRIIGVDPDRFTEDNLNRQLLAARDTVGQPKAEAAAARVAAVNCAVEFTAHVASLADLDDAALRGCSVAFDCLDSIAARRLLAGRCAAAGVVLIHGAIAGWAGQVGTCPPAGDLFDKLYPGQKRGAERRLGNLPFTAAVAANLMVARAAALLLQPDAPPAQQVQVFDLLAGEWDTIDL